MKGNGKIFILSLVLFLFLSLNIYADEEKSKEQKLKEAGFDTSNIDFYITKADVRDDGKILLVEYKKTDVPKVYDIIARFYDENHQLINTFNSYDGHPLTFLDDKSVRGYYLASFDYNDGNKRLQKHLYINERGEALFDSPFYQIQFFDIGLALIRMSWEDKTYYLVDMDGNVLKKVDGYDYVTLDEYNRLVKTTYNPDKKHVMEMGKDVDESTGVMKLSPDRGLYIINVSELTASIDKEMAKARTLTDIDVRWLDEKYSYVGVAPDKKSFIFEDESSQTIPHRNWNKEREFATISKGYKQYFIDFDGNILYKQGYYKLGERFAAYVDAKRMYLYQPIVAGKLLDDRAYTTLQYDNASACYRFQVKLGKVYKYGILDSKGNVLVKPDYDGMTELRNGLAQVRKGDKISVINTRGETASMAEYEKTREGLPYVEEYILDDTSNKSQSLENGLDYVYDLQREISRIVDADGNRLLNDRFDLKSVPVDGHIVISDNKRFGILDLNALKESFKGGKRDEK